MVGAFGVFAIAEGTPLHVSGVLAVVTLGVVMANRGRVRLSAVESMHHFWEIIEYMANTLIFVMVSALE